MLKLLQTFKKLQLNDAKHFCLIHDLPVYDNKTAADKTQLQKPSKIFYVYDHQIQFDV